MKYLSGSLCLSFLLIFSVFSCESPIGFTSPQPANAADLEIIPEVFQGIYLCDSDSALIKVNDKLIYSELTQIAFTPTEYIQEREDCEIIEDSLYMNGKEMCVKVEYTKNGFIAAVNIQRDTIFALSQYQRARWHKGHLVLSNLVTDDLWSIAILELDEHRGVTYRAITDDSDLNKIHAITEMTPIITKEGPDFKVQPKEVELDQLFEDYEIFVDCEHYTRVNVIQ